jgi:CSLREA domain-containing protein
MRLCLLIQVYLEGFMLRTTHPALKAGSLLLALLIGMMIMPVGIARAATITVNTTLDETANNTTCSLREAIIAANTNSNLHENNCNAGSNSGTDTITLANGAIYSLTIVGSGEDASATGDLDIVNNAAATDVIIKPNSGTATIQQNAATDDRVLHIFASVQLKKITISNGGDVDDGAGIFNGGGLILDAATVSNNIATDQGGGIHNGIDSALELKNGASITGNNAVYGGGIFNDDGAVTVTSGTINGNDANFGGGLANNAGTFTLFSGSVSGNDAVTHGGGIAADGTVFFFGGEVSNNSAGTDGGGIIFQSGNLNLFDTILDSNTAGGNGGAVHTSGQLVIDAGTLTNNSAVPTIGLGGAIYVHTSGSATLQNGTQVGSLLDGNSAGLGGGIFNTGNTSINGSTVAGNAADSDGGGIYSTITGTLSVVNSSSIHNNSAASGGGINNIAMTTIDGSTISANTVTGAGGGIRNGPVGSVTVSNDSTVDLNAAQWGAGIYTEGGVTIDDSTLADNDATAEGGAVYLADSVLNVTSSAFLSNTGTQGSAVFNNVNVVDAAEVNGSCIAGNNNTAVYNNTASSQDFTGNWWGNISGPSGAGPGSGDSVSANIDFSGFLTNEGDTCVENLLLNGSFEEDTTPADGRPDSWTGKNLVLDSAADGFDMDDLSDGLQSWRFVGDGNGSRLQQDVSISGNAGDSFTLYFDSARFQVAGGGAYRVKVTIYYDDGSKKNYKMDLLTGTDDFSLYTINAPATKDYNKIRVMLQFTRSAGYVFFDDVKLVLD